MGGMNDDLAISVRGLRKRYGPTAAIEHLDLDVHRGEVLALLGPNGAGKTTTVEILEGYRHRDAGDVTVLGRDPATPNAAWRARVGIVLQDSKDAAELTVQEVVRHFSRLYARHWDPDELIDAVGLTAKAGTRIRHLSGGQRRRVDVALGIVGRPELLFLDEPTTGFDPEARRQFWSLIDMLAQAGTTMVLTTHYLEEAEALADRVAVIDHGRLLDVGAPAVIGGRACAPATVTWSAPDGHHEVRTVNPAQVVCELRTLLDGEVPELTVTRPTLEDVYLEMIGAAS